MLELIFVLFLCSSQSPECQVLVVVPTQELCEQQKDALIEARGNPPEGVTLQCVQYDRKK